MSGRQPLLSIRNVTVKFGGVTAIDNVSFDVYPNETVGLIGPNGAGKTTLFNCVSGFTKPTEGQIHFLQKPTHKIPTHKMIHLGVGRTFQNLALFPSMTVLKNIMIGAHSKTKSGFFTSAFQLPKFFSEEKQLLEHANQLIQTLELQEVADQVVAGLSYGTLKRVEIARALISRPQLLVLDEPAGGLNHTEVDQLAALLRRVKSEFKTTIMLVEHNMKFVMGLSDRVIVFNFGKKIADGTPSQVQSDDEVIQAYLGEAA